MTKYHRPKLCQIQIQIFILLPYQHCATHVSYLYYCFVILSDSLSHLHENSRFKIIYFGCHREASELRKQAYFSIYLYSYYRTQVSQH